MRFDPNANIRREHVSIYSSTPKPDLEHQAAKAFSNPPPAVIQPAEMTAKQKVAHLANEFKKALLNISENRKKIYDVIVDLKEHFQEYGFKSPASAVETVCQRSKRWANLFCAEIEAEAEISQVGNTFPTEPDKTEKKEQKALSQVEAAREEESEKPHIKTRDEILEEQKDEPVTPQAPEQFKPSLDLSVWTAKVLKLFDVFPKSKLYNKLSPDNIKTFESSLASLCSVLGEFLPQKPAKILCKCGCGLSAEVSERLFKCGVPCKGLTPGQAGLVMRKMADNEWKLPRYFAFLKNEGEWKERQWRK